MKKILILVLSAVLLTGCGNSNSIVSDSQAQESTYPETLFERHPLDDDYSILVEKGTGVCYLEYSYGVRLRNGVYGITVMLNPDGTPKIWED